MEENIQKPSWFLYLTEGIRATMEFLRCIFHLMFYKYEKIGDDRPIIVVPGLTTSDLSMALLRRFLTKHGFNNVYPWGLGRNWGHLENIPQLADKLEQIYEKHHQKVTFIGWSLGGVYAREIAKQKPDLVRQLITLGSPFAQPDAPNHALWVYRLLNDVTQIDPIFWAQIPQPAPIPTTAIFSKRDGILPWQICQEKEDNLHQNIEVECSHFGLPMHREVLNIVINGLKTPVCA